MTFPFSALSRRRLTFLLLGLIAASGLLPAHAQNDGLPANLGRDLHELVQWRATQAAAQDAATRQSALSAHLDRNRRRVQTDGSGNVIVNVRLDGTVPATEVKKNLSALGLTLTSEHAARHADGRDGVVSAHLPLDKAAAAAKTPGVLSVVVARRPRVRVGKVTSQGVAALHADVVQARGYTGAGITIGVVSDSYDQATADSAGYAPATRAADDIASGDLPAAGVTVLQNDPDPVDDEVTDEGRAMLQIIHDVAPDAALAFSIDGGTQTDFADNIRTLRTNSTAPCDIILDDVTYFDEPFFSDGPAAQAVDEIVTSTSLAGRPVIYYSAAGNDGDLSYAADFTPVTDAAGRANPPGVNLTQVPENLTAGGFHNFKKAGIGRGTKIVQVVTISYDDATLNFQWDDPYGNPTTDYNLLVFDANGNYRDDLSGIDNNFRTGEPSELVSLPLNQDGSDTTYKLVISKSGNGAGTATHLRYIVEDSDATVVGKYLRTAQPTIYGHSGAANADGVAAYDVHDLSTPESYESFGPVTIYFDDAGNRLATPLVRQQPTIATVDGVDTTFFPEGPLNASDGSGTDSDNDGFPNFYGTSAAAPHAAGGAALLLQAAGGKGSLTAAAMRSLLESTAASHDLDAATSTALFASADGLFNVTLIAKGDASNNSAFDAKFFTLSFTGPVGSSLHKALIDVGPSGEDFDESIDNGFPLTIGEATGVNTSGLVNHLSTDGSGVASSLLFIKLPADAFPSGGSLAFGIDRDNAAAGNGGNDADVLAGSTVTVKFILANGTTDKAVGTLANKTGAGYSQDVGYGLINAQAALAKLLGQ